MRKPIKLSVRYTKSGMSLIAGGKVVQRFSGLYQHDSANAFASGWYGKPMVQFGFRFVDPEFVKGFYAKPGEAQPGEAQPGEAQPGEAPSNVVPFPAVARIPLSEYVYNDETEFSALVGLTLVSVKKVESDRRDELALISDTGRRFAIYHKQECCESVSLEDICGDLSDLCGSPIVRAEKRESREGGISKLAEREDDCEERWTFIELATNKGSVTLRFYGTSNGYYSMSAELFEQKTRAI